MISKKHKKTCANLDYTEHLLILASRVSGCISISPVASLVSIPVDIASSAVELKTCATTAELKRISQLLRQKKKEKMIQ